MKTEVDRIKSEGWLPESFWKAETLCGWYVDEEKKKLWAILLDMFREFIRICEIHDLKWFACGGTALGAIRHKGFIPWDDDLDVLMPREDYERLRILAKEFEHPYFLQWVDRDPGSGFSHLMIRNNNTTRFVPMFAYSRFNQGIFFDIFPLDSVPYDKINDIRKEIEPYIMANATRMKQTHPNLSERHKEQVLKWFKPNMTSVEVYHKIEEIAQRYNGTDTGYLAAVVACPYSPERLTYPKDLFCDYVTVPCEGIPIRLPKGWHELLKTTYGDYREMPPQEFRGVWHGEDKWILDVPYKEYLSKYWS